MKNPTEMPDEKLIQFYLSNNPAAMATLTDLYKDRIYNTIYATVKDKYAAEIIFRDVFVRIMNNLIAGKHPEGTTFLPWATAVAAQLCVEYSYKTMQPAVCNRHGNESYASQQDILPEVTYYDNHYRLRTMIYKLPDGQREVMIMNHYAGISFREIAGQMKCTVTTALDMMKFALGNLRKLMLEEGLVLG